MVRLSIAIQTHPKRADLAMALQGVLTGAQLAVDPNPTGYPSAWRSYAEALETTPDDATHRLIVQDDVLPCAGLLDVLPRVIAARPDDIISLYVGGMPRPYVRAVDQACWEGETFAKLQGYWLPTIAVVWPVEAICPHLCWIHGQGWPEKFSADDERLGRAVRHTGWPVVATVPSLVDHPDVTPSLVGMRHRAGADIARVAHCFIGDDDPAEIDWH